MTVVARVHFDGNVIIPDEPVDLPVGEVIEAEFRVGSQPGDRRAVTQADWDQFVSCVVPGLDLPQDAFSRENLYEDPA